MEPEVESIREKIAGIKADTLEIEQKRANLKRKNSKHKRALQKLEEAAKIQKNSSSKMEKTIYLTRNLKFLTINDYKILKLLGHGANGIVFLSEVTLNNEVFQVALKMILNFDLATIDLRGSFENEYMILHKLPSTHENVICIISEFIAQPTEQMLDYVGPLRECLYKENIQTGEVTARTTQFFVIEYHPATLDSKVGPNLAFKTILKYSLELLSCFLFLYENRIVHRDVKLNNVLVSKDDSIILSDYGESVETDFNHCCRKRDLRAGNLMHTAPEVLNQLETALFDEKIDFTHQYSWDAGCLLFEIAFARFPFESYPIGYGRAPAIKTPPLKTPDFASIPTEYSDLLAKLLTNEHKERLSVKKALKELKYLQRKYKW